MNDKLELKNENPAFGNVLLGAVPSEVFNEDCIALMKRYPDKFFDLAVVDPPYGLGDKLTQGGTWASKYAKGDASWDIAPPAEYWV
jgi:site-specific DNA-methyltransferase (adenine-specific)